MLRPGLARPVANIVSPGPAMAILLVAKVGIPDLLGNIRVFHISMGSASNVS